MSIRIRRIDGTMVALCAARTRAEPGDIYLDDAAHYALMEKAEKEHPACAEWPSCQHGEGHEKCLQDYRAWTKKQG